MADIRADWIRRNLRPNKRLRFAFKQTGGAIIHVRGHPIHIRESDDEDDNTYVYIYGGESKPCFRLELQTTNSGEATLGEIIRRHDCFMDYNQDARDIVRAAYQVARDRGIHTLTLSDMSTIRCPDRVILSDLSFLTTGKTWYESILPLQCTDCINLEEYRQLVHTNTWRTVGHGLIDINIPGIDIDIDAPGSAMAVLSALKKDGNYCWFFSKHMETLTRRSGVASLLWKTWVCHIPQQSQSQSQLQSQSQPQSKTRTTRRTSSWRKRTSTRRRTTNHRQSILG